MNIVYLQAYRFTQVTTKWDWLMDNIVWGRAVQRTDKSQPHPPDKRRGSGQPTETPHLQHVSTQHGKKSRGTKISISSSRFMLGLTIRLLTLSIRLSTILIRRVIDRRLSTLLLRLKIIFIILILILTGVFFLFLKMGLGFILIYIWGIVECHGNTLLISAFCTTISLFPYRSILNSL